MGSRDWGYAFWLFYFRSCNDSSVHYWTTIKKLEFLTLSVWSCKNSILLDCRITGKFRLTGRSLGEVCSLRASSATGSDQVAQGFAQSGCWTTQCQRQPALLGLCSMDRLLLYGKDFSLSPSWISLCFSPVWRIQLACSMPKKPTSAEDAVWSLEKTLAMAEPATAPQLHFTVQGIQTHHFSTFCSTVIFVVFLSPLKAWNWKFVVCPNGIECGKECKWQQ